MFGLSVWMVSALIAQQLPQQQLRIAIELPAYRLDALVGDTLMQRSPVAIGRNSFRTPRGDFAVTTIEWNPWWIPPDSPWAAHEKRTPPGPANPMGRVKINFSPFYFMHGTPDSGSVGSSASHGCVRMRNGDAIDLARLVHRYAAPRVSDDDIDRMLADADHTYTIEVKDRVPVEVRYDLAELLDDRVYLYRDVYGFASMSLRDEVYAAFARAGVDSTRVDSLSVRAFVREPVKAARSILLDSLLVRPLAESERPRVYIARRSPAAPPAASDSSPPTACRL